MIRVSQVPHDGRNVPQQLHAHVGAPHVRVEVCGAHGELREPSQGASGAHRPNQGQAQGHTLHYGQLQLGGCLFVQIFGTPEKQSVCLILGKITKMNVTSATILVMFKFCIPKRECLFKQSILKHNKNNSSTLSQ